MKYNFYKCNKCNLKYAITDGEYKILIEHVKYWFELEKNLHRCKDGNTRWIGDSLSSNSSYPILNKLISNLHAYLVIEEL